MSYSCVCVLRGVGSPNEFPVLVRHNPETGHLRPLSLGIPNIHVRVSVWTCIFISLYLEVELLGHVVILCLTSEELPNCSTVAMPFYKPMSNVQIFRFLHILANTYFP